VFGQVKKFEGRPTLNGRSNATNNKASLRKKIEGGRELSLRGIEREREKSRVARFKFEKIAIFVRKNSQNSHLINSPK
jgi:hypothetical protein